MHVKEYIKHNTMQLKANTQCLQEYDRNAAWRLNCGSVVDIGIADGSFTSNVLTKFLPKNCKRVVGLDIIEEMVQHANEKYGSELVSFKVLDVSKPISEGDYNKFDQAFSFFAIHMSKEQR